jgi:hypothetical protein
MWEIQILQRIPRLCIRCVTCDEVGKICNLIGLWVLNQYDGSGQHVTKEKIISFSCYCIPLKLVCTFRNLFMKFRPFGWLQNVSGLVFPCHTIYGRFTHSCTNAAFLTMSTIEMLRFYCNSVLYTLRIICFSNELSEFLLIASYVESESPYLSRSQSP